jgi:hypothetical protein
MTNGIVETLAHAMQSGVAQTLHLDPSSGTPKHLRVGVNMALVEVAALAGLLIEKGVFTREEYDAALIKGLRQEVNSYEESLSRAMGANVKLA